MTCTRGVKDELSRAEDSRKRETVQLSYRPTSIATVPTALAY